MIVGYVLFMLTLSGDYQLTSFHQTEQECIEAGEKLELEFLCTEMRAK